VRASRFTLAPDALAAIWYPGWSHQDLVFEGGQFGIVIGDSGAWPSSYRDLDFSGQQVAAIAHLRHALAEMDLPAAARGKPGGGPALLDEQTHEALRRALQSTLRDVQRLRMQIVQ
jgi:hypothetical protein